VLESSPGLEVVEISAPALHETFADHELKLPNGLNPDREFGAQHFLWHQAVTAPWTEWNGAEAQETALSLATCWLGEARTLRPASTSTIEFEPHDDELVFGFVVDGSACLDGAELGAADAFARLIRSGRSAG
jgi:hypothetical protein